MKLRNRIFSMPFSRYRRRLTVFQQPTILLNPLILAIYLSYVSSSIIFCRKTYSLLTTGPSAHFQSLGTLNITPAHNAPTQYCPIHTFFLMPFFFQSPSSAHQFYLIKKQLEIYFFQVKLFITVVLSNVYIMELAKLFLLSPALVWLSSLFCRYFKKTVFHWEMSFHDMLPLDIDSLRNNKKEKIDSASSFLQSMKIPGLAKMSTDSSRGWSTRCTRVENAS